MTKYLNRFKGHMRSGDPRTPVTGAGGCTWPTVPPWRIKLSSRNATGEWAFLNTKLLLLEQDPQSSSHNRVVWRAIDKPDEVYWVLVEKIYIPSLHPAFRYWLSILLTGWAHEWTWPKNCVGSCNRNLRWGDLRRSQRSASTGSSFTQHQIEFDKTDRTPVGG